MLKNDLGLSKHFKNTLFVTCWSKGQLIDRLAKHYATVSHVDRIKGLQKMLKPLCQRNAGGNQVTVSQIKATEERTLILSFILINQVQILNPQNFNRS